MGSDGQGVYLLGELGENRILFTLSMEGRLTGRRKLPPATQHAQILSSGEILARTANKLLALDDAGSVIWSQPVTARTEVAYHDAEILFANGSADGRIEVKLLDRAGSTEKVYNLDAEAEPVSLWLKGSVTSPLLVAACAGALRSCSEQGLSPGPYNRLWACHSDGLVSPLVEHASNLYFDVVLDGATAMVTATTAEGLDTALIEIDPLLQQRTLAHFEGRRMLGPVRGPVGIWLVATCQGHRCEQPWRLYAVSNRQER